MLVCVRARRHGEYMLIIAEQDYSGGRIHKHTHTLCEQECLWRKRTRTHIYTYTDIHIYTHIYLHAAFGEQE